MKFKWKDGMKSGSLPNYQSIDHKNEEARTHRAERKQVGHEERERERRNDLLLYDL